MPEDDTLRVATFVAHTEAEGPGRRFALWLQGCPLRCPGCCNPEMLPDEGGERATVSELLLLIARAHAREPLDGITLLGGEPFAQAGPAAALCRAVRARGLGVMILSGFTLEELAGQGADAGALLAACDLLVDGRYDRDQPDGERRFIGSTNQRVHHLTDRHRDHPSLAGPNTVELRLSRDGLVVNGWPALAAELSSRRKARS